MKEEILSITSDLREGSMTTNEAKEHLLRLFVVIGSVCDCSKFHNRNEILANKCISCGEKLH